MARTEAPGRDVTPLPARTGPLMLTHLVMTGDLAQHREWQEQIEEIRRLEAVDATTDPQRKALLQRRPVWTRMRRIGAMANFGLLPLVGA